MSKEYDNVPGLNRGPVQQRRLTQENIDRRILVTAANALLNKVMENYPIPRDASRLSDFPKEVQGKVKALTKAFDALMANVPFTVWIDTIIGGSLEISDFLMASSDGESIYKPTEISCQCLGSMNHNVCYHRWAYLILKNYLTILSGHEQIKEAYKKVGIEFELMQYERDTTEAIIDQMSERSPSKMTH